jgi:hypothetical protein
MPANDRPANDRPAHDETPEPQAAADDVKARMREALERKRSNDRGVAKPAGSRVRARGPEVRGAGPRMHRRKARGGGS